VRTEQVTPAPDGGTGAASRAADPSIALEGVGFRYGRVGAGVEDITLSIAEGELLAVIGPSGCGKSTVLKLIAGFFVPQRGVVRFAGRDVTALSPRERDLGVVFQTYALFPHMTIAGNVGYPLKLRGIAADEARRRVEGALTMVGLAALADRLPASLSGGQQQRVALARALVFRPRALLLDEPLSALDASIRAEMRDEIRRLQRHHGIATLHITHDQEEALSMADRVAVMGEGRLLQVGTPQAVYRAPASHAVARFVGHANLLEGQALDACHVQTQLGVLTSAPHAFGAGQPVSVLIRPQAIRPHEPADAQAMANGRASRSDVPNVIRGRTTRDRFLGSLRRLDFHCDAGPVLLLEVDDTSSVPVAVHLPPTAVQVIAPPAA
jgi:putative spermidine/putrescine transport system ATP-binding protein